MSTRKILATIAAIGCTMVLAAPAHADDYTFSGIVQNVYANGQWVSDGPPPTTCVGLTAATIYVSKQPTSTPIPIECGPVTACQCYLTPITAAVTVSGNVFGVTVNGENQLPTLAGLHLHTLTRN